MSGSAPLTGTALGPVPDGAAGEWFAGAGGVKLRVMRLSPAGAARGSVVVSPGRTEPVEKYFEVAGELAARGFAVLVHDWRGQGLSDRPLPDRLLGHAAGFGDFVRDYGLMLDAYGPQLPRPWLSLAHSMGGCLALLALAQGEARIAGALVTAPMCAVLTAPLPRPLVRLLARALTAIGLGGGPIPGRGAGATPFEDNRLTHDAARYARNEAFVAACPDLALGAPTWAWVDSAFAATDVLTKGPGVPRIAVPVTLLASGSEVLVDNAVTRAVAQRLPNARYLEIAEAYHEVLQETDPVRAVFWREFDALAAQVGI